MKILTKPTVVAQNWVTATDIENAKANLLMSSTIINLLEADGATMAKTVTELAFRQFIEYDAKQLAKTLNTMSADSEHLQILIGQLSYKLRTHKEHSLNNFYNAMIPVTLAYNIFNSLVEINIITKENKVLPIFDEETGKKSWHTQQFLTFGVTHYQEESMYIPGVHTSPTIVQKQTKVRNGGKVRKLNSAEKKLLLQAGSTKLRLSNTPVSLIKQFMMQSEWYLQVLKGEVQMDKIVADDLINRQLAKYKELQSMDHFYLSMWLDYRGRMYYDMKELGFNPHGKLFETSLYELADPRYITAQGFEVLAYAAATIVDGRMAHHTAIEKFESDVNHYLTALKTPVEDMGETLYNSRLAQAIEDYYSETPSHFMVAEDATNGGLQHGGIGFKEPKMMIPANVGGAPTQQDSHATMQYILNLATRQDAKDIHQPLLHGSSMKTVATMLGKTESEAKTMLAELYGNSILNIPTIADFGVNAIDNNNTSLQWTMPDGIKAQSIAYTESVPLTIHALSTQTKTGYTSVKLLKEMPILLDAKGKPVYGKVDNGTAKGDRTMGAETKIRGLYANITHSIDSLALRNIVRCELQAMYKHDDFICHPNDMHAVRESYKQSLLAEYDNSLYQSALDQISEQVGAPRLELIQGGADKQMIQDSKYYLAP